MEAKQNPDRLFGKVIGYFLISRLLLLILGLFTLSNFSSASARVLFNVSDLSYHQPQPSVLEMWARWDSEWYLLIADHGYNSYEFYRDYGRGKYLPQETAKFFPGYPLAIRLFSFVTGNSVLAGILVSNIAAIAFLYFFWRICSKLSDAASASRSALFYLVFPTSFFLNAVYAESLFLAALTASFFYLEEKRLLPACAFCAAAMLTRPQAVLAVPALLWLAFRQMPDRKSLAITALVLCSALPLAGFLLYVQQVFGSSRWVVEAQNFWRGEMQYPLYALVRFARSNIAIHGQHNSSIDFTFAVLQLLVVILSFKILPGPYFLYSALAVLFPLSSSLFSFSRLSLANFPFFLYLGSRVTGRWAFLMQTIFAIMLAYFMMLFANWYWVG